MLVKFGKPGGGDLFIEPALVRVVMEKAGGGATVHFDKDHTVAVSEGAADVVKMLGGPRR